jgi:hypothetical protein
MHKQKLVHGVSVWVLFGLSTIKKMKKYLLAFMLTLLTLNFASADDFVAEQEDDVTFSADTLTLDADDTGGDVQLKFGEALAEALEWDSANTRFSLSDDLDLQNNELINVRVENLSSAPVCNASKIGQIYYNTTDKLTYSCDGVSVWNPFENALNATIEFPVVQARRTTSYTLTTSYADVTLDTTDLENDVTTIDHDDTLRDRIDIGATAMYQIIYGYTAGGSATSTHEARARVRVNDATVLPGSASVNKNYQNEFSTTSASFLANLNDGDFISLQLQRDGTTDVTQDEIYFSIIKLEGIKGDPGPAGADGISGDPSGSSFQTFTIDNDNTGGNVSLQFGAALGEFLTWDNANSEFDLSDDLNINGNFQQAGNAITLDSDNTGGGANVSIIAEQGTDANGELRYNATSNKWEASEDGGAFENILGSDVCGTHAAFVTERGTVNSNQYMAFGNGRQTQGTPMGCSGTVVLTGGMCSGTTGTALPMLLYKNNTATTCTFNNSTTAGTGTITSCNETFTGTDVLNMRTGTEVGAWTECTATFWVQYD